MNNESTQFHPFVICCLLIGGFLLFLLPKKNSLMLFIILGILIPFEQRFVLFGLNLMAMRILILITFIRFIMRNELGIFKANLIDKVVIIWIIISAFNYILLWQSGAAVINRLGFVYNSLCLYVLFRVFIRDIGDVDTSIKTLIAVALVVAISMTIEQLSGRNLFSALGLPEFTNVRDGRLRSQGPFAVCITAGTFGATLLPLFISLLWSDNSNKRLVFIGILSSTVITLTSASSGPLITYFMVLIGYLMWRFRRNMRQIRWGVIIMIMTLHLVMKAPVWALIARMNIVSGSSSYHRYKLIDNFIMRFDEWWLLGTKSTDHWGWMMWDTVNQYILQGIKGGLISLILFITIIILSFRCLGRRLWSADMGLDEKKRIWSFGVALFAHAVAFIGISYFDQIQVIWYLLLAMISILSDSSGKVPVQCSKIKL